MSFIENLHDNLNRGHYSEVALDLEIYNENLLATYKVPQITQPFIFHYFDYFITSIIQSFVIKRDCKKRIISVKIVPVHIKSYDHYRIEQNENVKALGVLYYVLLENERSFLSSKIDNLNFIKKKRMLYYNVINHFFNELADRTEFLEHIAIYNTNLVFMLLRNKLPYSKKLVWFVIGQKLISEKNSKLCRELDETTSVQRQTLDFLFSDFSLSEEIFVWRPIGEYVLQHLRDINQREYYEYNAYKVNIIEIAKKSPIYLCITFFRIMVNRGLKNNVNDHLWLMYLEYWAGEIIKYTVSRYQGDDEYANQSEYFLYLIIDSFEDWINYYKREEASYENDLIINKSICSMVTVVKIITSSNHLNLQLKDKVSSMMISNYFQLLKYNNQEKAEQYIEQYEKCISEEVEFPSQSNTEFIRFLKKPLEDESSLFWYDGNWYDNEMKVKFLTFLNSCYQI